MMFVWMVSGGIFVALAYLLAADSVNPWSGVRGAEIAAAIYVLVLVLYSTRAPFPKKGRIVSIVSAVIIVGATGFFSMTLEKNIAWQQNQLLKILGVIQRGIISSEMPEPLLTTLDRIHNRRENSGKTVRQVFDQVVPGAAVGKNIEAREDNRDSLRYYVAVLSDDQVVLIGQPSWGRGWAPSFKNFNGRTGLPQVRAVLTKKGVSYESEN